LPSLLPLLIPLVASKTQGGVFNSKTTIVNGQLHIRLTYSLSYLRISKRDIQLITVLTNTSYTQMT
jgi:hypothetical protein